MLYHFYFFFFFTLPNLKSIFYYIYYYYFTYNKYLIQYNIQIKQITPNIKQTFTQTQLILLLLTKIIPNTTIYIPTLIINHLINFFKLLLFITTIFKTNISLNNYKKFFILYILILILI